jgi:hypothetical protein
MYTEDIIYVIASPYNIIFFSQVSTLSFLLSLLTHGIRPCPQLCRSPALAASSCRPRTGARRSAGHPARACTAARRLRYAAQMSPSGNSTGSKEAAVRSTDEPKRKLHQLVLTPPSALTSSQMQSCFLVLGTVVQTDAGASRGRARMDDRWSPVQRSPGPWPAAPRATELVRTAQGRRAWWISHPRPAGPARRSSSGRPVVAQLSLSPWPVALARCSSPGHLTASCAVHLVRCAHGRWCPHMDLPGPTTSVGTRTDYSVDP